MSGEKIMSKELKIVHKFLQLYFERCNLDYQNYLANPAMMR